MANGELRQWLTTQLGEALRLNPGSIKGDVPLLQLGMDSLIALELRNRIDERLGVSLPLPELIASQGLDELISRLEDGGDAPERSHLPADGGKSATTWVSGAI